MLRKRPSLHQASPGLGMRTSLSPHAGGLRGPSQGQGAFTSLSQLTLGYHGGSRVRVRVSRIWVASDPNSGVEYGLCCFLIDGEGVVMQACALSRDMLPHHMKRLKHQLVEGKVYTMSNFVVRQKHEKDKYMACNNDLVINMGAQTLVNEMTDHAGSSIPLHSFEFVDFGDLPSRNNDRSLLTDVIGQIVSIEDEGQTWKWGALRNISFRNIHLRDLGGKQLKVALYGDLGRNFDAEQVFMQDRKAPVVAIFAGMLVEHYKGFIVQSTSASKYYLDLDIEVVQKFRASLNGPHRPINRLPCRLQKPVNPTELVDIWRTIKQLTSLNPDELQRTWLCRATLKGIDCNKGLSYRSCFHCSHSISCDGSKFLCITRCPNNKLPVERYKLDAVMEDDTGSMNVMIFDAPAQKLVGVAAELIGGATGDDISAVISSQQRRAFVVTFGNGCFVVKDVLNDDQLQQLDSGFGHVEAGDHSDLSQDEGSYASHGSSSQVKKDKMVIKKEMKAAVGGDEPEVESSSASCSPSPLKNVKKEDMATEEENQRGRRLPKAMRLTTQIQNVPFLQPTFHLRRCVLCTWFNRSSNSSLE